MATPHLKIRETEYLVVGAGATGCAFGLLMKQAGADVLLLEMQNPQQRVKLCAGILENRAETAFCGIFGQTVDEAGLAPVRIETMCGWDDTKELRRAMPGCRLPSNVPDEAGIHTEKSLGAMLRGYVRSGKALAKKVVLEALGYDPGCGFSFRALPRKRLDDYIRDRYLVEGGHVLYRTKPVSVDAEAGLAECIDLLTKEKFFIRFRYIIGADGAMSGVRRLLTGRQQRVYLALEAPVPLVRSDAVGRLTKGAQGYCWYIPRGMDATVGCGFHNVGGQAMEIYHKRLSLFCADLGIAEPSRFLGAFIPEGDDVLLRIGENAYLLGDAAGLNDAFTGGGIHYALLSAQALAASFVGGVAYEDAMQPHVNFVKRSSANVKWYYDVANAVIAGFGKQRG